MLPQDLQDEIFGFWEDYRLGISQESKFMKALDKMEGILHHIQEADNDDMYMIDFLGIHGNKQVSKAPETKEIHKILKKLLKQFLAQRGIQRKKEYNEY